MCACVCVCVCVCMYMTTYQICTFIELISHAHMEKTRLTHRLPISLPSQHTNDLVRTGESFSFQHVRFHEGREKEASLYFVLYLVPSMLFLESSPCLYAWEYGR